MGGELSRPIVVTPLYVGGRAVTIGGHIAGAFVEIYRYDEHGTLDPTPIGDRDAPNAEWFNVRVPELGLRDRIFAKQTLLDTGEDSDNASFAQAVEVQGFPAGGLRAPLIDPPIYNCGKAVKVYNIVNGAWVTVYVREVGTTNGWDRAASAPNGCSRAKFNFRDPVKEDTEYMAIQRFPDIDSPESNIEPVVPYPEEHLPPPTILGQSREGQVFLPECAPSFKVAGTEPGATLTVYREGDPNPIAVVEGVDEGVTNVEVEHPPGLVRDWEVYAVQELCGPDRSEESERAIVMGIEDYLNEFTPVIVPSLESGGDTLTVQGAHESTIRIIADGEVIGIATCYGTTEVQLDEHIEEYGADEFLPTQSFMCNGEEITGEGEPVPRDVLLASEPLDVEERNQVLDAHNDCREVFRNEVGLTPAQCPDLVWSDELAHWAQLYATYLAVEEPVPIHHSDRHTQRGDPRDGENIAWSLGTVASFAAFIESEWCEGEGGLYFDDGQPPIEEVEEGEERNWMVWGHYTQVVWSDTTAVGCGRARSARGTRYWVCQYRVGGNRIGQWPHGRPP
jgi:hypothetical protein